MTPVTEGAPRPSSDARHAHAEETTQDPRAWTEEQAHAQSRHEADIEGIKLCGLLIVAFGYPCGWPLVRGEHLDSAAIACGLIAACAALLLAREGVERARTWSARTLATWP